MPSQDKPLEQRVDTLLTNPLLGLALCAYGIALGVNEMSIQCVRLTYAMRGIPTVRLIGGEDDPESSFDSYVPKF